MEQDKVVEPGLNGGAERRTSDEPRREAEGRGEWRSGAPRTSRADVARGEKNDVTRPKRRRYLSAQKKYEIFLECAKANAPIGEILRREGMYSSDLTRIREQVREGALQRLKQRPGREKETLPQEEVEQLQHELRQKERALVELSVEYVALKKGGSKDSMERLDREGSWPSRRRSG